MDFIHFKSILFVCFRSRKHSLGRWILLGYPPHKVSALCDGVVCPVVRRRLITYFIWIFYAALCAQLEDESDFLFLGIILVEDDAVSVCCGARFMMVQMCDCTLNEGKVQSTHTDVRPP